MAALAAGASVAHTTITGLGERAGNVPVEDVVMALLCLHGVNLGINTEKFVEVSRYVMELAKVTQPPNRPIVGDKLYEVESGIIAGWVRMARKEHPLEYVPFAPELVGQKPVSIVLGKNSGPPSMEEWCEKLGITATDEERMAMLQRREGEVVREEGSADGRRVQGNRRARDAEGACLKRSSQFTVHGANVCEL